MFYLIGTGINDFTDISLKGINACKNCDYVFIERYTSMISDDSIIELKKLIEKDIIELDRNDLETNFGEIILNKAKNGVVGLLVIGDPLTATTHIEFLRDCKEKNVKSKVIHSSSIFSSVCETGLHVYKFGKSCSIPYPEKNFNPTSFFDVIKHNYENNSHTLVFLDIKNNKKRFMTINEGLNILINISKEKNEFFNEDTKVIGIARLGSDNQMIKFGTVKELLDFDFGKNPHIFIVPKMGSIEREYVSYLYSI